MKLKFAFIFSLIILSSFNSYSQDFKIISGFGIPDYLYVGGGISITKSNEILLTAGYAYKEVINTTPILSLSLGHRLYLKNNHDSTAQQTWFFGQKIYYIHRMNIRFNVNYVFANLSFGRNHYFTKNFGFYWNSGLLFVLLEKKVDTNTNRSVSEHYEPLPKVYPSLQIGLFLRLSKT